MHDHTSQQGSSGLGHGKDSEKEVKDGRGIVAHLLGKGQSRSINDGGPGVRHGTDHGDTASQGGSCA